MKPEIAGRVETLPHVKCMAKLLNTLSNDQVVLAREIPACGRVEPLNKGDVSPDLASEGAGARSIHQHSKEACEGHGFSLVIVTVPLLGRHKGRGLLGIPEKPIQTL